MLIRDKTEFKKILGEANTLLPVEDPNYILLHTTKDKWRVDLFLRLLAINDNPHIQVALLVKHDTVRIDTILFSCKRNDVTSSFLPQLSNYIDNIDNTESILKFLERQWQESTTQYPMLLMFTTRLDQLQNYTIITNLAIAPAYRKRGLMKEITLNLLELIQREFGTEHSIKAFTIHPATYLLFNPWDKELKSFSDHDLQESSCKMLLKINGRAECEDEYCFTEAGIQALFRFGILKPPVSDSPESLSSPSPTLG